MASDDFSNAMKKAAGILSRRMHSSSEMRAKLSKKFPPETVRGVLSELARLSYLDDARFATAYAAELKSKGLGRRMIVRKLMQRGINAELCEKSIPPDSPESEKALAMEFVSSHLKSLSRVADPRKRKEKLFRMLKSRGFSNDAIFGAMENELSAD